VQRILNATGILLHTNLGRARMDDLSSRRAAEAAAECFDLEFDLTTGQRGDRYRNVRQRLQRLVGAEDGLVVNNNAAAVFLLVHALAAGRDVLVSRGELVEIGGSFRIPDIVASAGARLVLVGSANVTAVDDYARAIGPDTALLLKVHQSNFRHRGQTSAVAAVDLVDLGRRAGIPVAEDLGSGTLLPLEGFGLPPEPTVPAVVASGVDLVTFSGDKLLGGPQSGIIGGRQALVRQIRASALLRTLRVGKVVDALLCECLDRYLEGRHDELPFVAMARASLASLDERARRIVAAVDARTLELTVVDSRAQVGAGACPEYTMPSRAIDVAAPERSPDALKTARLAGVVALVGRVARDRLLLDLRSLLPQDDAAVVAALRDVDGD